MQKVIRAYSRLCNVVERITNFVLVIMIIGLIAAVSLQIFSRMLNSSVLWTVDVGILLLIWTTFLAAGIGIRRNSHFVIDLWPDRWRKWSLFLDLFSILSILTLGIIFFVGGMNYVIDTLKSTSGMTNMPMYYLYLSLPMGSVLIILFSIEVLLKKIFRVEDGGELV